MAGRNLGTEKDIIFYNTDTDNIEVMVQNENVWLNSYALATLFDIDRTGIARHVNNIYSEGELEENSNLCKNCTSSKRRK